MIFIISPGKAVGFLFIPFFNYYWIFVVFRGFAVEFNKLYGSAGCRLSVGLATTLSILLVLNGLLWAVPGLAELLLIAVAVIYICFYINLDHQLERLNP